jgi:putative ABC transport system substrate-binding protein
MSASNPKPHNDGRCKKDNVNGPVVFVMGADPIKSRLVAQLNRPGANLTRVSFFTNQMESKRLGLLHELVPNVELIGVLLNANNPFFDSQLKDLNEASYTWRKGARRTSKH